MEKVFQYAVDTMGFFIDSDIIWFDYNNFLESNLRDSSDRTQRSNPNARRRRFYQKAVVIPFHSSVKSRLQSRLGIHVERLLCL